MLQDEDIHALYEALQATLTVIQLFPDTARGLIAATNPEMFKKAAAAFENSGRPAEAKSIRGLVHLIADLKN